MNKKNFYKLAIIMILLFSFIPNNAYASKLNLNLKQGYNILLPPSIKTLKGDKELKKIFTTIKSIRRNMDTIKVDSTDSDADFENLRKYTKLYIIELNEQEAELKRLREQYKESRADTVFIRQFEMIIDSMKLSLEEVLVLIEAIKSDEPIGKEMFYSECLEQIYFYLNLSDEVISYMENYYNL